MSGIDKKYINTCSSCGCLFEAERQHEYKCPACKSIAKFERLGREYEERKKLKPKAKRPAPELSIADIQAMTTEHEKKSGKYISYGKMVAKIENGEKL